MRKVKIQCTIGPSCNDPQILKDMMKAGMEVARVNLSHGSAVSQKDKLENFREAAYLSGKYESAIMFDVRGPEIRVKEIPGGSVFVSKDETLTLHCEDIMTGQAEDEEFEKIKYGSYTDNIIRINYRSLCNEVETGNKILIDDGKICLTVESVDGQDIICYVERGGEIKSRKGINVPGVKLQMDYLGEDDVEDILWCVENGVDYVAGSFIRRKEDVETIRNLLEANGGGNISVIAKIECLEAVRNIDEIIKAADQILVARGDLAVEIGFEKVPAVQKLITHKCRDAGKAVIVATQILDSMTESLTPTRAEVSDIANAVYDGATDLLVTGETASGKYPVEVVLEMDKVIKQAEHDLDRYGEEFL